MKDFQDRDESLSADTPRDTIEIPIEEYASGSYAQRALVDQLLEIDPQLKSVNLLL
ncbi:MULTISPECIES: hypothetical protein [Corynebacterium]|uniref:hypothetical protein n=1 Tax=Corynebacterium TaxID=1716 RepID=UPI0002317408|nr:MULTISPECIES: hypothetical protein [Corynebacterium]QJS15364.1 hypothetical protein HK412_03190 [Corynebacterium glutamicum]QXU46657.1 hypothetical protein KW808_05165 [[Brevibacterium] flavum]